MRFFLRKKFARKRGLRDPTSLRDQFVGIQRKPLAGMTQYSERCIKNSAYLNLRVAFDRVV